MSGRGRVCFYSERSYPVLARVGEFAGGGEVLTVEMARRLVRLGFDVSLVSCDFGQEDGVVIDGVRVHRTFALDAGVRVLRFFQNRLPLSVSALARADAEVYYVIGAGMAAGLAHDVARARRAGFVLHAMSDYDVEPALQRHNLRDRWWYRRALHDADQVLAQTEYQRGAFREHHGVESAVLPNAIPLPGRPVDAGQDGHIMWLGTYKRIKRPSWFLRLAREYPGRRFVMAGGIPPPPLTRFHWDAAQVAARSCPNLAVHGFRSPEELDALLRGSSLIVHTSPREGFSNVMLEAWALGLPTVSAVDPDGLVSTLGFGTVATDYDSLVDAVGRLMTDPEGRRAAGRRAREFVRTRHAPQVVVAQAAEHLDRVVAEVRHRRGGA
jgi:glycosyltransferase involved in cell wall biosynthesis